MTQSPLSNPIFEAWQIEAPRQHVVEDEQTGSKFKIPVYGSPSIDEVSYYASLVGKQFNLQTAGKLAIQQTLFDFLVLQFRMGTWNGEEVVLDDEYKGLGLDDIVPSDIPFSLYMKVLNFLIDQAQNFSKGGEQASGGKPQPSQNAIGDSGKSSLRRKNSKAKTLAVVPST